MLLCAPEIRVLPLFTNFDCGCDFSGVLTFSFDPSDSQNCDLKFSLAPVWLDYLKHPKTSIIPVMAESADLSRPFLPYL